MISNPTNASGPRYTTPRQMPQPMSCRRLLFNFENLLLFCSGRTQKQVVEQVRDGFGHRPAFG